jgi:transcriptional regulator with XRE-family HTH domain
LLSKGAVVSNTHPRRRASDRAFAGSLQSRIRHARRIAKLSQAALAESLGVRSSAVAQWELPDGTRPTVNHMLAVAAATGVAFEWLATGRGDVAPGCEMPVVDSSAFALDDTEERLLVAFRRLPGRKKKGVLVWVETLL